MSTSKQNFWSSAKKWLPGVLISVLALFLVFQLANWQDLGPALTSIRPIFIISGVVLTIVFVFVRAIASRTILGGKPTIIQAFWAINQGYLLNNLLPLRAGELGRAILLGQSAKINPMEVLSSVVIERVFDVAVAATMLLITLPLALGMDWARNVALIALLAVIIALGMMFYMARNRDKVTGWVHKLGKRWAFVDKYVVPQVSALIDGLATVAKPSQFFLSLFWIVLSWAVAMVEYYIFVLAVAPSAPFWWGVFTDAVLGLSIAVPSAPAALGTFEAGIVGALAILGVGETDALALAITIHFIQFFSTGILGLYAFIRQGRSLGNIFKEFRVDTKNETVS